MRKTSDSIQRRIEEIKRELTALGPMQPGSISEQYNVCGTPGCRCKDPKNPRKHGPYPKFSYTWRGKVHNEFMTKEDLQEKLEMVRAYKRCRELTGEWSLAPLNSPLPPPKAAATNEWVDLALERAQAGRAKK